MQYAIEIGSNFSFQVSYGTVETFKVKWRIFMTHVYEISSAI